MRQDLVFYKVRRQCQGLLCHSVQLLQSQAVHLMVHLGTAYVLSLGTIGTESSNASGGTTENVT